MTPMKGTSGPGRVRLGELLVKAGVITDIQLKTALQEQKQWGGKLGDILVRMRYVSEDIFVRALSKQLGLPRADLSVPIPPEALAKVAAEVAEEYELIPVALSEDGKTLTVATSDPLNITVLDYLRSTTSCRIAAQVAGATSIRAAIAKLYQTDDNQGEGTLRIVTNAEDSALAGGGPQRKTTPPSRPPLPLATANTTGATSVSRSAAVAQQTYYPPPSMPTPALGMPYPQNMQATPGPYGYGYGTMPPQQQMPQQQMQPTPAGGMNPDDAQRREVLALRALVELLVQKGVISLDEYLARLKR